VEPAAGDTASRAGGAERSGDELRRLIDAEAHNDELVRRARDQAAELIRTARAEAAEQQTVFAAELERIAAEQTAALIIDRDRRITDVRTRATEDAARYDDVDEARIAAIAAKLIDALISGAAG
jgi:vacuolar-type H+-ATPase subunit H